MSLLSTRVHIGRRHIANWITLPNGINGITRFDWRRRRPGRIDLGVIDVTQSVVVDPHDVLVFVAVADVLGGEYVARMNDLAGRLVEADDADDEIALARGERLFGHAEQRAVGVDRMEQNPAERQGRVLRLDEMHRLEGDEPPALLRHARTDHPDL